MSKGSQNDNFENETKEDKVECFMPVDDADVKPDEINRSDTTLSITSASRCIIKKSRKTVGGKRVCKRKKDHQLKQAFDKLQRALPNIPEGTKLSRLDILLLAANHISYLMSNICQRYAEEHLKRMNEKGALRPIKKWPLRTRLVVTDPQCTEQPSTQMQPSGDRNAVEPNPRRKNSGITDTTYATSHVAFGDENTLPPSKSINQ